MSAAFAIGRERLPSPRSRKLMRQPLTAIRVFRPPSRTRGTARVHRANRIRIECIRPPSGSDSDGNRIGKTIVGSASATTTTGYLIDPQNPTGYTKAIDERTTIGATTTTRSYVLGNKVEAQSDATNGVLYLLTDGHGSTRALTSTSGAVIERYDYDAFGTTLASGTSSANAKTSWLFGGDGIYDPASGWTYHLARWRDGFRFTSYDSFEADRGSPANLNKYVYGVGNPEAHMDANGRFAVGFASLLVGAGLSFWARESWNSFSLHLGQAGLDLLGLESFYLITNERFQLSDVEARAGRGPLGGALPDSFVFQFGMSGSVGILPKGGLHMGIGAQETYDLLWLARDPGKLYLYHSLGFVAGTQGGATTFMYGPGWNLLGPDDYTGLFASTSAGAFGTLRPRLTPGLGALSVGSIFNGFGAELWWGPQPTSAGRTGIGLMVGPGIGTPGLSVSTVLSDYELIDTLDARTILGGSLPNPGTGIFGMLDYGNRHGSEIMQRLRSLG